jgi:ankyrin repeat protein
MLLRKADWHDYEGIKFLLEHGADPNRPLRWGKTAFHNAILSDNALDILELFLDHGADPSLVAERPRRFRAASTPRSAVAMAARRGRGDLLRALERRGLPVALQGVERLIAACATSAAPEARSIVEREPARLRELLAEGATLLAEFAGNGNTGGVGLLLDFGAEVDARYEGDPYFGIAPESTALHVAAWRARHATLRLLVQRGAAVNLPDGEGRTPLALAVRACVESYWTHLRSPESVEALLGAGASAAGIPFPSGYGPVDELLRPHLP